VTIICEETDRLPRTRSAAGSSLRLLEQNSGSAEGDLSGGLSRIGQIFSNNIRSLGNRQSLSHRVDRRHEFDSCFLQVGTGVLEISAQKLRLLDQLSKRSVLR
jgi:hypothetical protein